MVTIKSPILTLALLDVTILVFYTYVLVMNFQEFNHTQELLLQIQELMKFKDHLDLLKIQMPDEINEFLLILNLFLFFFVFEFKYFKQF